MSDDQTKQSQLAEVLDLARHIRDNGSVVKGFDGKLWRWVSGYYQPNGREELASVLMRMVPAITPTNIDNACRLLEHGHPYIDEARRQEPGLINLRNGVLDMRTGAFTTHDIGGFPWRWQLPVEWDPAAACPAVDRFLAEVMPDQVHIDLMYEMFAYCLLPGQPFKRAFLLTGKGDNGKSVLLRLLQGLLGSDNCAAIPLRELSDSRFQTARLPGKLLNYCGDMGRASVPDTQVVKLITGGDRITAEHKNGHPFDFTADCKLVFAANSLPDTFYHEDAWHSRWVVVEFTRTFDAEAIATWVTDRREEELLSADERQGLLVKVVEAGCRLLERGRFELPDAVRQAGDAYAVANNPVRQFLQEHPLTADASTKRSEVFPVYKRWAVEIVGIDPRRVGRRPDVLGALRDLGMVERKVGGDWLVNIEIPGDGF